MIRRAGGMVHLIGRIDGVPSFEALPSGGEMMSLNLSTRVSGDKSRAPRLAWHRVVSFAPAVHRVARDLSPGDDVSVHGFLERRAYEQNGIWHEVWEIVADWVERLPGSRTSTV